LLRVPGLGVRAVNLLLASRRWRRPRLADIGRLTVSIARVRRFITTDAWRPVALTDHSDLAAILKPPRLRLELF
jgi:predicted DNA-binding helix-hairpin-helix protein